MNRYVLAAVLLLPLIALADDETDPQPCKFKAHTAVGTVSGACITQDMPTPGYNSRWTLTLIFDAKTEALARGLKPDQFCDMMRAQSTASGVDEVVLSLWGDLKITPLDPEYNDQIKQTAPLYETTPNLVTISQVSDSPYTLLMLFEEPAAYFNPVMRLPSQEWWSEFLKSYYHMGTNRPNGFSIDGGVVPPSRAQAKKARAAAAK